MQRLGLLALVLVACAPKVMSDADFSLACQQGLTAQLARGQRLMARRIDHIEHLRGGQLVLTGEAILTGAHHERLGPRVYACSARRDTFLQAKISLP